MIIKPIETAYKGYRFRSRLEARWAVFFDALGIPWEYEKEGFELGDYGRYLPDFWLPDFKLWIEVKGKPATDDEKIKAMVLSEQTGCDVLFFGNIPDLENDIFWQLPDGQIDREWSVMLPLSVNSWERRISGDMYFNNEWGLHMYCPVCNEEYVHFGVPRHKITDDYDAWDGRGSAIHIPMWCEYGHSWVLRLGFHKGYTFVDIENVNEAVENPGLVLSGGNRKKFLDSCKAARSARFEFGEVGV